jgi:hypothetical protein
MTSAVISSTASPGEPRTRHRRPAPGQGWAYLGIVVGATASIAANIAHSFVRPTGLPDGQIWRPETGAVLSAMFWPTALLITTEIMARTAWPPGRAWLILRFAGLLPVAAVAAVVSYLHLHGLLRHYHEAPVTTVIAPLSVDGLMVMASSALVATNRHHRLRALPPSATPAACDTPPQAVTDTVSPRDTGTRRCEGCGVREATTTWTHPAAGAAFHLCTGCADGLIPAAGSTTTSGRTSVAAHVWQLAATCPDMTATDMAAAVGVSPRTVRRHLAAYRTNTSHPTRT